MDRTPTAPCASTGPRSQFRRRIAVMTTALLGFAAVGTIAAPVTTVHAATPVTVQILGINDFHGRIQASQMEAGAAVLGGAVDQLRAQYPDTVFAAAGDLIGASTFESFIQQDKPTLDALNAAGLQVSAVGNHEFDKGYGDLVDRVMAPYDATTNPLGGAAWQYLGANVRNTADDSPALPESWVTSFGDIEVGFVGAVTDHLPELVSPAGLTGLTIEPPVVAANREADEMKAAGVDIVVLLVHEGATTTTIESATDPTSDFGEIVTGADANIDAIVSGHTHLAYNHLVPVQAWIDEGRPVITRPVVSAGQYGYNLNQLLFTVDDDTDQVIGLQTAVLPLVTAVSVGTTTAYTANYPASQPVADIVTAAVDAAVPLGAVELGQIGGPFLRSKLADGATENRGGESTLGNLVAEVQRWATQSDVTGAAQIAFMNPGGLRADMVGNVAAPATYPAALTYRQAATVQPFANTLVNMQLTGAQLKTVLEQQWQPVGASRPFLRLGISEGFTYTYDPAATAGSHITHMWLDGVEIEATASYSVTVNSFLAAGGDNFLELANGAAKRDTGRSDLQAMVDYMAANKRVTPDYSQRSVGVTQPADAPGAFMPGDTVSLNLTSLSFSNAADAKDTELSLTLGGTAVGTATVTTTIGTDVFDEYGTAAVSFVVPPDVAAGVQTLTMIGNVTGTVVRVPLTIVVPTTTSTTLSATWARRTFGRPGPTLIAAVATSDGSAIDGTVEFMAGDVLLGSVPVTDGTARLTLPSDTPAGDLTVTATFAGTDTVIGSQSEALTIHTARAPSITTLRASAPSQRFGTRHPIVLRATVRVPAVGTATGTVEFRTGSVVFATVAVVDGVATLTLSRWASVRQHSYTATFVPDDAANIIGSKSNKVRIRVR
jgi:5'-nucleotidase